MLKLIIATIFTLSLTTLVEAQIRQCSPREDMIKFLTEKYQEKLKILALISGGKMEIFVSPKGATFSVLLSSPSGNKVCIVAAGTNFQIIEFPIPGQDL